MLCLVIFRWFVFLLYLPAVFAETAPIYSAARMPWESYEEAEKRYLVQTRSAENNARGDTVHGSAGPVDQLKFFEVPKWSAEQLKVIFERVRNERFLEDPEHADFSRRSSWLYPHDGCFARAALAGQRIEKWEFDRPAKIFVFGSLNVKTPNSASGEVSWWYHVVPLVVNQEDGLPFVLDPAIDPKQALPLKDWFLKMVATIEDLKASVCNPYAYTPGSSCLSAPSDDDDWAHQDQISYLYDEWSNLVQLKRDPFQELGDSPPWFGFSPLAFSVR